ETITRREPADLHGIPKEQVVHFDREIVVEGMWSAVRDRLTEAGPEATLWASESEYRFSGLLMRLMGPLMRGAFRKQSQQRMQDFKASAEQGEDVREAKGGPPGGVRLGRGGARPASSGASRQGASGRRAREPRSGPVALGETRRPAAARPSGVVTTPSTVPSLA